MEAFECMARAASWDYAYASKGNEQVAVEVQFLDGPMKDRSLTYYGNFGDDVSGEHTRTEWTKIDLMKMGWDGNDWLTLDGLGSKEFRVRVEPDTYNGRTTMKIRRIFAAGGLAVRNRMTEEQKKALVNRLKSGTKAAQKNDDDIPF